MASNLVEEIAAKAEALPREEQRRVLQMVDALMSQSESMLLEDPHILPPLVTDDDERSRLLEEIVKEMKDHPLQGNPPRLTRDELHERR